MTYFKETALLSQISASELDNFLAAGWFPMHHFIFEASHWDFDGITKDLHWLRYSLKDLNLSDEARKIVKAASQFTSTTTNARVNQERALLFDLYRSTVPAYGYSELDQEIHKPNKFKSHVIEVRDQGKLVGVGEFYEGKTATTGILNFFHPDYRKFQIGKYLMLLQLQWSKENGKMFYYPGYIADAYPPMMYKVYASRKNIERLDIKIKRWIPLDVSRYMRTGMV